MSEYNFEIRHIKGSANSCADALSRHPDYDQGDNDNREVTVLPDHVFIGATHTIPIEGEARIITPEEMMPQDPIYYQDESILKPWVNAHQLKDIQGVWYKDGKCVVTGGLYDK